MDHQSMKEQLLALYDGELGPAERQDVETHMAGCLECRERYGRWARTAKLLFQAPKVDSSEFFVRRVMDRIHALEAPKPGIRWRLSPGWLIPAFALALMLIAVVPPAYQVMPMEAFLFQEIASNSSWAFLNSAPTEDDTLQFVMEG